MSIFTKDYIAWKKENESFLHELDEHDTVLFEKFKPIIKALDYLAKLEKLDEDQESILEFGIGYLHSEFGFVKDYLELTFKNDIHEFLEYEKLINYLIDLESLIADLDEKKIKYKNDLNKLADDISDIIENKKEINPNYYIYINDVIKSSFNDRNFEFFNVSSVFVEICESLGIDLYEVEEIVIGHDLEV